MRTNSAFLIAALIANCLPLFAQESQPIKLRDNASDQDNVPQRDSWTKTLKDRSKRGTLHDNFQFVRGDSGKWNDAPRLQHSPPIGQKPAKTPLDDWADALLERDFQITTNDDNWLLLRTRQLDDNDRVWVERIERRERQFTIVLSEAIWQGRYLKTFTYYDVFGVNLGKLEPGKYEAKWIIKPLVFNQFDGDGRPTNNWPKDERPAETKPTELRVTFSVVAGKP